MDSLSSSVGSRLNYLGGVQSGGGGHQSHHGVQDFTKMSLTDDYFSDVNIKTMRRLMNVIYVIGRLLKVDIIWCWRLGFLFNK